MPLDWLYKVTEKYYGTEGQQSIDPVVFFKLMLIGYLENLNSDRRIINMIKFRLDMLYFIGEVKLTDARALLLYVLYDLIRNGEYVSEFSSEKGCYFLQRFGAREYFKLAYEPNFYGPYSGKVRYILDNPKAYAGAIDKKTFKSLFQQFTRTWEEEQQLENKDTQFHTVIKKKLNSLYLKRRLILINRRILP